MIRNLLRSLPQVVVPFALGALLARRIGPLGAAAAVAGLGLAGATLGALLLRSAKVGEVTWRNLAAGWLLPFGGFFGGGQLPKFVATSSAFVALIGALGAATAWSPPGPSPAVSNGAPTTVGPFLGAALALDVVALLFLVRSYRMQSPGSSARRSILKPIACIVGFAVGGVVLHQSGRPLAGAWLSGGPLLAIGVLYGLWVLMMVTVGRNARWN